MTHDVHSTPAVRVERAPDHAWVWLDRPSHANAYDASMLAQIDAAFDRLEADPACRAVVISGAGGRVFCAGADRDELATRSPASVRSLASARVFERIRCSPLVTIAAIDGAAVGGGLELALACDLRIAAEHARFWLPEPEFGLLPAAGALPWLAPMVGVARARELILGGARWSAHEAQAAGLVADVVETGTLREAVDRWVTRIVRRDPEALRLAKEALRAYEEGRGDPAADRDAQARLVEHSRTGTPHAPPAQPIRDPEDA